MDRRDFLLNTAKAGAFAMTTNLFGGALNLNQVKAAVGNKTLVTLYLGGGLDGLHACVPVGDPHYYDNRKKDHADISWNENELIDIGDSAIKLNPYLASFKDLLDAGSLAIFPATHNDSMSFSHFTNRDRIFSGMTYNDPFKGWLNRTLEANHAGESFKGVSLTGSLPSILKGDYPVANFNSVGSTAINQDVETSVRAVIDDFANNPDKVQEKVVKLFSQEFFKTKTEIDDVAALGPYVPGNNVVYPSNGLSPKLKEAANLIKAKNVNYIYLSFPGGYESHDSNGYKGTATGTGYVNGHLQVLADSLKAFHDDLGDKMNDVAVLVFSEFGRRAYVNGSGGTDHGWGNSWFVMSKNINAGVYGGGSDYPSLAEASLYRGSLDFNIKNHDIVSELLVEHMGINNIGDVFPHLTYTPTGFVK